MARVVIERMALGVHLPKREFEEVLCNAEPLTTNDLGDSSHVSGGEASVWRAGNDGEYAVKVFKRESESHAEQEFERLSSLQSENGYTPKVYCYGTLVDDEGSERKAIVEEYIGGYTLAEVLKQGLLTDGAQNAGLNAMQTTMIALELARGINQLESAGVAHRDISHNNVLLGHQCISNRLQNGIDLYLIDFGSSTFTYKADETILGPGVKLAAIPFGAPEMYGGDYYNACTFSDGSSTPGRNSGNTDVWSLGAVITYMMYGKAYWPEGIRDIKRNGFGYTGNPYGELRRIVEAKEEPIDLLRIIRQTREPSRADMELAEIVRACTVFDPGLRPELSGIMAKLNRLREYIDTQNDSTVTPIIIDNDNERRVEKSALPDEDDNAHQGDMALTFMSRSEQILVLVALILLVVLGVPFALGYDVLKAPDSTSDSYVDEVKSEYGKIDNYSRLLDVNTDTPYAEDVEWLVKSGIATGWVMPDGDILYRPNAYVTRVDMASSLYNLAELQGFVDGTWQPTALQKKAFADVDEDTPHAREIWWLASAGIANGTETDGVFEFRPLENVERCDMASFLFRLAKLDGRGGASNDWSASSVQRSMFRDVDSKTRHAKSIWWVVSMRIAKGWEAANGYEFRPYEKIDRADMATLLHRFADL